MDAPAASLVSYSLRIWNAPMQLLTHNLHYADPQRKDEARALRTYLCIQLFLTIEKRHKNHHWTVQIPVLQYITSGQSQDLSLHLPVVSQMPA